MASRITQITENLYLSGLTAIKEESTSQFDRVISVCQDKAEDNVTVPYSHHNMSDGVADTYHPDSECTYGIVEDAANELYQALADGEQVLIHCHMGQSRSVSVATAAIARLRDIEEYRYAYNIVKEARPQAHPNDTLHDFVLKYINEYVRNTPE